MRRGVGVGADQDDAGLAKTELRSGDVENALTIVAPTEPGDLIFVGVADQQLDHIAYVRIGNAGNAPGPGLRISRNVVIGKCKDLVRVSDRQSSLVQRIERMPRAFVNKTAVDVEQRLVLLLG